MLRKLLAAASIALLSGHVAAGDALSWNLSRDMMRGYTQNPTGVWAFMQAFNNHDPSHYQLLSKYSSPCIDSMGNPMAGATCWQADPYNVVAIVGHAGTPFMHPGYDRSVAVRWTSPVVGSVNISGVVSDGHPGCGDGVVWYIDLGSTTLASGAIINQGSTFNVQSVPVTVGSELYLLVSRGSTHQCDTTVFDLLITSQQ